MLTVYFISTGHEGNVSFVGSEDIYVDQCRKGSTAFLNKGQINQILPLFPVNNRFGIPLTADKSVISYSIQTQIHWTSIVSVSKRLNE